MRLRDMVTPKSLMDKGAILKSLVLKSNGIIQNKIQLHSVKIKYM